MQHKKKKIDQCEVALSKKCLTRKHLIRSCALNTLYPFLKNAYKNNVAIPQKDKSFQNLNELQLNYSCISVDNITSTSSAMHGHRAMLLQYIAVFECNFAL